MMRTARIEDLPALVEGNREMARETEGIELDPATLEEGVRAVLEGREPGAYYVLEEDGVVAAQLMVTYEWSDWRNATIWWIQSVHVAPKSRQKGCFTALYRAVREEACARGAAGLRLYVELENHRAHRVYEALGMRGDRYLVFEEMLPAAQGV